MPLTDLAIRKIQPLPTVKRYFDGGGLYLEVSPAGGKWWRWKYRHAGKEKRLALGVYPEVGLAAARSKRDEARKLIAAGIDPGVQRKAQKRAAILSAENSFEVVALSWLETQHRTLEPITIRKAKSMLEMWAFPWLGSLPVTDIKPLQVLDVLRRLEARGAHETAHRLKARIAQIYRYAIVNGLAETNPAGDMRGALQPIISTPRAAITDPHLVGQLLRAIDGFSGTFAVCCALKLSALLFVRPGELRTAEWSEFQLEGENPVWNIPPARRKLTRLQKLSAQAKPHAVPLAPQAVAILRDLYVVTGSHTHLFPGTRSPRTPISNVTINAALRRMGFDKDTMTAHGFRALASSLLNEQGWNPDAIERQLSHVDKDKVRAAYNRSQYMDERRTMMNAWADYLDVLKQGHLLLPVTSNKPNSVGVGSRPH
jgi:integrase